MFDLRIRMLSMDLLLRMYLRTYVRSHEHIHMPRETLSVERQQDTVDAAIERWGLVGKGEEEDLFVDIHSSETRCSCEHCEHMECPCAHGGRGCMQVCLHGRTAVHKFSRLALCTYVCM